MPHCLVACDSLVELKFKSRVHIYGCFLKLPNTAGFIGLKSLGHNVRLDPKLFTKFISNLPLLENLCMVSCVITKLKSLDISFTSLMNLALESIDGGNNSGNYKLKIACPNLVSFNCIVYALLLHHFAFESLNSL